MNYHPTNDYPINLDDIYSTIGFANKGNAKKTLENNFTVNEDYKIALVHMEKRDTHMKKAACALAQAGQNTVNLGGAGFNKELLVHMEKQTKEFRFLNSLKFWFKNKNINYKKKYL